MRTFRVWGWALAVSAGFAIALPSSAAAGLLIENNFPSGTGNMVIKLQEGSTTDEIGCTSSSVAGTVNNPANAKATLTSWTLSGCTAYGFGPASVTVLSLPTIEAVSTSAVKFGPFTLRVQYNVSGSTCRADVTMGTWNYEYQAFSTVNQLGAASAPHSFSFTGGFPPPACLSGGTGSAATVIQFPAPQFKVSQQFSPRVSASMTSTGALNLNYTGTSSWTAGNPPSGTVTSVSVANHPQAGPLVGVVGTNGLVYVKQGASGSWVHQYTGATAVSVANDANGPVIAVLGTDGHVYAKRGMTGTWHDEIFGATSVAIASDTTNGPVLGVTSVDGHAYAKQGLTGIWHDEYAGAESVSVATDPTNGPYIAVLGSDDHAYAKKGLTGAWIDERAGADSVSIATDATNGPILGVLGENDHAYVKQGLTGAWTDQSASVASLSVGGSPDGSPLIGVLGTNGTARVKRGLNGTFVNFFSGAQAFAFAD